MKDNRVIFNNSKNPSVTSDTTPIRLSGISTSTPLNKSRRLTSYSDVSDFRHITCTYVVIDFFSYFRNLSEAWDQLTTLYPLFKSAARWAQYLDCEQTAWDVSYGIKPDCPVGVRFSIPIENPDDIERIVLELSKRAFLYGYFDIKQISYDQYSISGLASIRALRPKHPKAHNKKSNSAVDKTRQRSVVFFPGKGVDTQKMGKLTDVERQMFSDKRVEQQRRFPDLFYNGVICSRSPLVMMIFGEFEEEANSHHQVD